MRHLAHHGWAFADHVVLGFVRRAVWDRILRTPRLTLGRVTALRRTFTVAVSFCKAISPLRPRPRAPPHVRGRRSQCEFGCKSPHGGGRFCPSCAPARGQRAARGGRQCSGALRCATAHMRPTGEPGPRPRPHTPRRGPRAVTFMTTAPSPPGGFRWGAQGKSRTADRTGVGGSSSATRRPSGRAPRVPSPTSAPQKEGYNQQLGNSCTSVTTRKD